MSIPFYLVRPGFGGRRRVRLEFFLLLAALGWPLSTAQAQCPAGSIVATAGGNYTLTAGQTLCIPAGVAFAGTVTVTGAGCAVVNRGEVTTSSITLQQPATLTNYGTWSAEHYSTLPSGTVLDNQGNWSGTVYSITQGLTLNNAGTWNAGLYGNSGTAAISITNAGRWQSSFSLTGTITLTNTSTGQWGSNASPSLTGATTIQNAGTWAAGSSPSVNGNLRISNTGTWYPAPNYSNGTLSVSNAGTWYPTINFSVNNADSFENLAGGLVEVANIFFNGAGHLDNSGRLTVTGTLYLSNASVISNYAGATFNASNGTSVAGPSEVSNAGTWNTDSYINNGRTTTQGLLNVTKSLLSRGTLITGADGTVRTGTSLETTLGSTTSHAGTFSVGTDFTNRGAMNGATSGPPGRINLNGISTNTGSFATTGKLLICDAGQPAGAWDVQTGTVEWTNTSACYSLPVQLTSFTAQRTATSVLLRWTTAQELSNAGFAVQQSSDGRRWQSVAWQPGAGTSTQPRTYTLPLPTPAEPAYYRLVQRDQDGREMPSTVVYVAAAATPLAVYPNPASGYLRLGGAATGPLRLLDLRGREVRRWAVAGALLDVRGLPAGSYLLHPAAGPPLRVTLR